MISQDLLNILACPETKGELEVATPDETENFASSDHSVCPDPPKAAPISAPLPCWRSTIPIKNTQTQI